MGLGHIAAAGTGQPGDAFFLLAEIDAEESGDLLVYVHGVDGALAGLLFAGYQLLGEGAAAGGAAGTADGVRQHLHDHVDAGNHLHQQSLAGHGQDAGEQQPQEEHESYGDKGAAESCFHVVTGL